MNYDRSRTVVLQTALVEGVQVEYSDGFKEVIEYGYDPSMDGDGLDGKYMEVWPNDPETFLNVNQGQ